MLYYIPWGNFADMTKVILRWREYPVLSRSVHLITWALKSKDPFPWGSDAVWRLQPPLLHLKMEVRVHKPGDQVAFRSWEQPWAKSKEMGPQSYNVKELNCSNNLNEKRHKFLPRALRKEYSVADTMISAKWDCVGLLTYRSCEVTHFGCFKPLSLW